MDVKPLKVMVEEFFPLILPLLLVLLLLLLLVHQLRQPRLPPGVPRLPFLGSLPWLIGSGKKMMELVEINHSHHQVEVAQYQVEEKQVHLLKKKNEVNKNEKIHVVVFMMYDIQ